MVLAIDTGLPRADQLLSWLQSGHHETSYVLTFNTDKVYLKLKEDPRDGGVWWAAVYGVAQSRTQLKRFLAAAAEMQTPLATRARQLRGIPAWTVFTPRL